MSNRKRKIITIISIVILSFTIMGIVYALLSDNMTLINKIKIGTLQIEDLNLKIINQKEEEVESMLPGDIDILSWTTKNVGTSAVLTRQTIEIYWDDDVEQINEESRKMIYMFPANISEEVILEDYVKGEQAQYMLKSEKVSKEIGGKVKKGIKYQFIGDTLNGSDGNDVSKEINHNSTETAVIDSNINTDDNDAKLDEIAFRLLMNPQTSYLYEGTDIKVIITTEGMQYTEDGSESWKVLDTQEIN